MKKLLIFVSAVLLLAPAAAFAAGGQFTDDDTSVFEADIEWLAHAGVTAGCNPPTNDNYCPTDSVTRGQMAAFMRRFASYLGAEDGIVNQADIATTADNAATLDGMPSEAFVPQGDIVMTHGLGAFGNPAAAVRVFGQSLSNETGSGFGNMPITGPKELGAVAYGLKSITYCLDIIVPPTRIASVVVSGSTAQNADVVTATDTTDRTVDGCYSVTVNNPTSTSFTISYQFGGGAGELRIYSVTSTWAPAASIPESSTQARDLGSVPTDGSNG